MATLTNTKVKDTYQTLLKITAGSIGTGFSVVQDGAGNDSGLSVSDTGAGVQKLTFINMPVTGTTETSALFLNSSREVIVKELAASAFTNPSIVGSTGISVSGTYPLYTITNTAPDQTVSFTGTDISIGGSYPNFTLTNDAPDQVVSIAGGANLTVSGTYPSFTINHDIKSVATFATDAGVPAQITVPATNMTMTVAGGTGIETVSDDATKTLSIVNTAPDQVVSIAGTGGVDVTGTYPSFTIDGSNVQSGIFEEMFVGIPEAPYPLGSNSSQSVSFSIPDNTSETTSYHLGQAPAKLSSPQQDYILNSSGVPQIVYVDISAHVQVDSPNSDITYKLNYNNGSGFVAKQAVTRYKGFTGEQVDSFWGVFLLGAGHILNISISSDSGNVTLLPNTQIKFQVKEKGNII